MRQTTSLLLVCLVTLAGTGCHSIYRQPGAALPTDPCELLKLRIEEAQHAEKAVEQAESRVQPLVGRPATTDLDRMEAATFEFARRISSIHDAATQCKDEEKFGPETERLEQQHKTFLQHIQSLREMAN